ncbi:MAG: NADH-quinone oxidoreductase subunit B family protein [Sulfolobales archaeon]|nr:NADH-quinone oxidoreductase subunit B family protein [Sulfolobales archaeon]MCX8198864.1 NADH-quinone oxidoreductase subunit B family protein [Sulfolobales archaeon]MDW8170738.1 NADH-quinone oxidoreductase subunit B family protein [Desulfurococcaceae archaeon]
MSRAKVISYSPWVAHFNTGACNGCDIEVLATLTPLYDPERFGVKLSPSIRHADILIVTGAVTKKAAERLKRLYEQMPRPKYVIAVGACAIDGGVFSKSYSVVAGADRVVPVDVYVPGCPPRPEAILDGILQLVQKLRSGGVSGGSK